MAISLQSGLREYNGDLTQYTGILGGLTPDIHTLRSLNPETTNRVICVMHRGPYFLMKYFNESNMYGSNEFLTYKKIIEYFNIGIQCNMGDASLAPATLQGGFAGRTINVPTTQNTNNNQTLTITVPELVGRPMTNFHNMWVDGIADEFTGLTTYQGLVAGSVNDNGIPQRIFAPAAGGDTIGLEPSPAWEVAEFLIIALDRSGARAEAAAMALGCYPANKIGNEIFNANPQGSSTILQMQLTFNCQFVRSAFVNDIATRYLSQFANFGNGLNLNPGVGDAFFDDKANTPYGDINTPMFNGGKRPDLDAIQSGVGNAPVFKANNVRTVRDAIPEKVIQPGDHSQIYNDANTTTPIRNPYASKVITDPGT